MSQLKEDIILSMITNSTETYNVAKWRIMREGLEKIVADLRAMTSDVDSKIFDKLEDVEKDLLKLHRKLISTNCDPSQQALKQSSSDTAETVAPIEEYWLQNMKKREDAGILCHTLRSLLHMDTNRNFETFKEELRTIFEHLRKQNLNETFYGEAKTTDANLLILLNTPFGKFVCHLHKAVESSYAGLHGATIKTRDFQKLFMQLSVSESQVKKYVQAERNVKGLCRNDVFKQEQTTTFPNICYDDEEEDIDDFGVNSLTQINSPQNASWKTGTIVKQECLYSGSGRSVVDKSTLENSNYGVAVYVNKYQDGVEDNKDDQNLNNRVKNLLSEIESHPIAVRYKSGLEDTENEDKNLLKFLNKELTDSKKVLQDVRSRLHDDMRDQNLKSPEVQPPVDIHETDCVSTSSATGTSLNTGADNGSFPPEVSIRKEKSSTTRFATIGKHS